MKSLLKILAAVFLSMTLANCAMLGLSDDEDDKKTEDTSTMSDSDKESMDSEDSEESEESASADAFDSDSEDDDENTADTDMGGNDQNYSADDNSPAVEPEPEPARAEASAPFKDGMYTFATDCTMREDPEGNAPSAGTVRGGKKLWVEGYDNGWVKVFKKSGPVFVSKGCL